MMERGSKSQFGPSYKFITRKRMNNIAIQFIVWEAYKDKKISREVYDFCIKNKIADKDLIAMWKKVWIRFSLYEVEGVRKAVLHCVCSKQRTQLWVNVHLQSSA